MLGLILGALVYSGQTTAAGVMAGDDGLDDGLAGGGRYLGQPGRELDHQAPRLVAVGRRPVRVDDHRLAGNGHGCCGR